MSGELLRDRQVRALVEEVADVAAPQVVRAIRAFAPRAEPSRLSKYQRFAQALVARDSEWQGCSAGWRDGIVAS